LNSNWTQAASRELLGLRGIQPAWGYRRDGTPCVEPTSLAALGLLASRDRDSTGLALDAARTAADWTESIQRQSGALPVSPRLTQPTWSTPYCILLWNALPGHEPARRRACRWLLSVTGETHQPKLADDVVGHDPSLAGWPWVEGTHSWIEPTAAAILALSREKMDEHVRVRNATRMILDRALDHGGWNCGNKTVFGRELRPQPGPTALALLALAACGHSSAAVFRAVDYLCAVLPGLRAAVSLGWGVLALRAFDALPPQAEEWLAGAYAQAAGRVDAVMSLALLLLAADVDGPSLVGVSRPAKSTRKRPATSGHSFTESEP
jgi:hypothetical protein